MTGTWKVVGVLALALAATGAVFAWAPLKRLKDPNRDTARAARAELEGQRFFDMLAEGRSLNRPFPTMIGSQGAPDEDLADLGRLLFFDPVLSGKNKTSCAHCHHPDHGFADGRERGMGFGGEGVGPQRSGGVVLGRNTPTAWNAAFNHVQFWDGRAADLEEQARGPITHPDEMGQDAAELTRELTAIPEYRERFAAAFGEGQIDLERVTRAIAAFERTLLAVNAPFDRYARGDREALTPAQRRGLAAFRSLKTRCFECHNLPTFANRDFKVIGVPPEGEEPADRGRGAVAGETYDHAFKVPTLRNVALTAPYMHNGSFATLEQVVDFYADGGGRGAGFDLPQIDDKIRRFNLSEADRGDLIEFLHALTDESSLPEVPAEVPSGLAVIAHSARTPPAAPTAAAPSAREDRPPTTLRVGPGQTIQASIDAARPGDTIEVAPGTYSETLLFDNDDITLRGVVEGDRRAVLDGRGELSDAVIGSGRHLTIEGFEIRDYTANGVMLNLSEDVVLRDLVAINTGLYGVYPVESVGVLVEGCKVTGARDAGIYVGQCKDVEVRGCEASGNVTGIEIENCVDALVEDNLVTDNAGGILVFLLPNNPSKVSRGCLVRDNQVISNNHENFAAEGSAVSNVPSGTGILILGADEVEVTANEIRGNDTCGIAVLSLENFAVSKTGGLDVDPWPDRVNVHGNALDENGRAPAAMARAQGIEGSDLLWDVTGEGNSWDEAGASAAPPLLPGQEWGDGRRRLFRRLWRAMGG